MNRNFKIIAFASTLLFTVTPSFGQSTEWNRRVSGMVAAKQFYPRVAQMRGQQGTARVKVSINAAGAVDNVELLSSSGSPLLDREAVDLARRAGPYPAPPGGAASVVLPLTWKLL